MKHLGMSGTLAVYIARGQSSALLCLTVIYVLLFPYYQDYMRLLEQGTHFQVLMGLKVGS